MPNINALNIEHSAEDTNKYVYIYIYKNPKGRQKLRSSFIKTLFESKNVYVNKRL